MKNFFSTAAPLLFAALVVVLPTYLYLYALLWGET